MWICEECGHQHETQSCTHCQADNPLEARFCNRCGKPIVDLSGDKAEKKKLKIDPYDIENRVLCADGNCIGVIGEDGRCTDCGKTPEEVRASEAA
jgi:ribosomal protein L40E